jgi:NAD(P)H-flavin reductase
MSIKITEVPNLCLGNCPKYLNSKIIHPALPKPRLISNSLPLPQEALDLVAKADLFFISSSNRLLDMDTNHRGGPPGFVRFLTNSTDGATVFVYPEYSGNRLYQTLGNLHINPRAGICFPDFDTGNVLYVTGTTEILVGEGAEKVLPRSNLAVKVTVTATRFVEKGLGFRGELGQRSPYNPPVRYLSTEKAPVSGPDGKSNTTATLIKREVITPTISRYRFRISDFSLEWKAGQHVALSFAKELEMGYSHMRDDDPKSLNDDYLRTFTVSSPPISTSAAGLSKGEFEITARKVGVVTYFLSQQRVELALEVPLKGFGGDFAIEQKWEEHVAFVAGGVGITPLLAQLPMLDLACFHLLWTIRVDDLNLISDLFTTHPNLPNSTRLFVTGADGTLTNAQKDLLEKVSSICPKVQNRRVLEKDVSDSAIESEDIRKWYICTSPPLRENLLAWLKDKEVFYEDFGY